MLGWFIPQGYIVERYCWFLMQVDTRESLQRQLFQQIQSTLKQFLPAESGSDGESVVDCLMKYYSIRVSTYMPEKARWHVSRHAKIQQSWKKECIRDGDAQWNPSGPGKLCTPSTAVQVCNLKLRLLYLQPVNLHSQELWNAEHSCSKFWHGDKGIKW